MGRAAVLVETVIARFDDRAEDIVDRLGGL
jgi:hypothetical protein